MKLSRVMSAPRIVSAVGISLMWFISPIQVSAQPPFGGFGDRGGFGGDRGGFGGDRGGPPGGFGGDRGGPPGGFDPSSFLSRLDRNGNGELEPDEQEGPASFLIRRLESIDPKIKPGSTISLKRITKAFDDMRSGRSSGDSDRGDDRDRDRNQDRDENSMQFEPLVPGFGVIEELTPVPGFGPAGEQFSVVTTDKDKADAQEALNRYDRNRDGILDQKEVSEGRFRGNPLDFDRNGDGKMSMAELTTRAAVRRQAEEGSRDERREENSSDSEESKREPLKSDFNGRKSFRALPPKSPEGLPSFFVDRDLNQDGQIAMSEYTSEWSDARIDEFYQWDTNSDGVITDNEVRAGVDRGAVASSAPVGTLSSMTSSPAPQTAPAANATVTAPPLAVPSNLPPPSERTLSTAKRIIDRYDKNGDGALSAKEWEPMLLSPAAADGDGDGRVTVLEYAQYTELRSRK